MTNYEKYKDEIIQALFVNGSIGIDRKTGEFRGCGSLNCQGDCVFGIDNDGICDLGTTKEWLDSEYAESEKEEVDWSKVPMDTMVLVKLIVLKCLPMVQQAGRSVPLRVGDTLNYIKMIEHKENKGGDITGKPKGIFATAPSA